MADQYPVPDVNQAVVAQWVWVRAGDIQVGMAVLYRGITYYVDSIEKSGGALTATVKLSTVSSAGYKVNLIRNAADWVEVFRVPKEGDVLVYS